MSELAAVVAQLTGSNQQPAPDPALAAVKLARASIEALVLKLGQTIDAKVVAQLAAGLTQLTSGSESFVLKLETPLPTGTAVTIKVAQTPQGQPAVTVSVPTAAAPVAQPMPVTTPTAPLVQPQAASPTPQPVLQPTQPPPAAPDAPPATIPGLPATSRQSAIPNTPQAGQQASPGPQPAQRPALAVAQPVVVAGQPAPDLVSGTQIPQPASPASLSRPPVAASPPQAALPAAAQTFSPSQISGQPAAQSPTSVPTPAITAATAQPAAAAQTQLTPPLSAVGPATPSAVPLSVGQPAAQPVSVATPQVGSVPAVPQPVLPAGPPAAQPPQTVPTQASPYPVRPPQAPTTALSQQLPPAAAATLRSPASPLNLADPAQAAARQDSAAPLLAQLASIATAAATLPALPRPVLEMALKLLANRIDLNRAAPDAKTLEAAVLKAGVLLVPPSREPATDSKTGLLALRSSLLAFLGGDTSAPVANTERPAPPIKGEPPRAPAPQVALPDPSADAHDTARSLLGHTDAALSRLKLLQSASQPADIRADSPAPRNELRVEIPMLLGTQTGILQLMVERDAKHKREPERQRGWRMRFAMNFSATGEVGADIALLGRSASVAIWAADPDTAEALEALLPELAPAIQRHGLDLTSLRVRRGAPQPARTAPGRLLDSAR